MFQIFTASSRTWESFNKLQKGQISTTGFMIVNFTSCVFVFLENVATDYYLLNQQVEGEREMEGR